VGSSGLLPAELLSPGLAAWLPAAARGGGRLSQLLLCVRNCSFIAMASVLSEPILCSVWAMHRAGSVAS